MNVVIERMDNKMLRMYLGILEKQNPMWETQPESFEAEEIVKIGLLLGLDSNSSLQSLGKIEEMTVELFFELKEKGYTLTQMRNACGMSKGVFYDWRKKMESYSKSLEVKEHDCYKNHRNKRI